MSRAITVLDLRDSPWVDGPGRTILDCAQSLTARRCYVIIGAFVNDEQGENAYARTAKERNLCVEAVHERGPYDVTTIARIVELVRKHDADLVHSHDPRSNLFGMIAARYCRIPLIATIHGWIQNDWKSKLVVKLDQFVLQQANHLIFVSESTKCRFGRSQSISSKSSVIPNALVTSTYGKSGSSAGLRAELGLAPETRLFACIGRLSPEKGQLDYLLACQRVARMSDEAHFLILGSGPDQTALTTAVRQLGIEERVHFLGYRSDMEGVYRDLDFVVQASYTEGMPNVILESLLMEVPVIATDVGGTAEIVCHDIHGVLFEPGNVDALTALMLDGLERRTRHREMAKAGSERIRVEFDHARRVERLLAVYSRALDPCVKLEDIERVSR